MLRKAVAFEIKDVSQSGPMEFGGYASVFGVIDRTGDIVVAGAFRETLAQFLKDGVIAYQHRWDCPIGKPIDCYEDGHGLFLRARLADVEMARECHTLMREGIVTKLSIGYDIVESEWLSEENIEGYLGDGAAPSARELARALDWGRALKRLNLYEVSPVSVPANPECDITTVKSGVLGGLALPEHAELVRGANAELCARLAQHVAQLKEGRVLSAATRERIAGVRTSAWSVCEGLDALLADAEGEKAACGSVGVWECGREEGAGGSDGLDGSEGSDSGSVAREAFVAQRVRAEVVMARVNGVAV